MKFHGIHQSQSGNTTASEIRDTFTASSRRKTSSPAGCSNKKRKVDNYADVKSNLNTDDDEGLSDVKAESSMTVKTEIKTESIKEEPTEKDSVSDSIKSTDSTVSTGTFQHIADGATDFNGIHDSAMFDDFLAFGGSIQPDNESQAALNGGHSDKEVASLGMAPATRSGDGRGVHESILITD